MVVQNKINSKNVLDYICGMRSLILFNRLIFQFIENEWIDCKFGCIWLTTFLYIRQISTFNYLFTIILLIASVTNWFFRFSSSAAICDAFF